ncbi:hypothetical protein F0P96_17680 [Hymenobacter busanensis]|uniref:Uncharacterized protein n=1 Tax=Hymenobacter busanensis TaxID=2607656 RepID=A0A7L5A209_9BACT|nr:hypothetical protein [Hymenobacter busanensis]KAA9327070.1 hypothetical protein F0P96_17680 [Hymenobacter busanensis]QHJ09521.1 hypothetical protein GUY19_20495 [Hymenobacter busanensis]
MNPRLSFLLLLLVSVVALSGCAKDQPTPSHTKAWLRQADGDLLTFRNPATGATETMLAKVEDVTVTSAGKFDFKSHDYQTITLTYTTQRPSSAGLRVVFNGDGEVAINPLSEWPESEVTIITHKKSHKEHVISSNRSSALLDDNVYLNGRTYPTVVSGRFNFFSGLPNVPSSGNSLEFFWYSKDDGLVAYTLTDGQTWYRVW